MTSELLNREESNPPYPWHLFWRTFALLVAFLLIGICDGLKGPTLLDLTDHYHVTVAEISFVLVLSSIGSLIGCLVLGLVMDRLKRYRYLIVSGQLILLGVSVLLYPMFPHVAGLFTVSFFSGLGGGSLDAGGQVLLLDIWRDGDSGPYMHALHFMFGIGAFLGPIIARPFLSNTEEVDLHHMSAEDFNNKSSAFTDTQHHAKLEPDDKLADVNVILEEDSIWNIHLLFPMVGSLPIILSTVFLLYFISDERSKKTAQEKEEITEKKDDTKHSSGQLIGYKLAVLVVIMLFFFLYVGQEVAFGTFIPVFAVECDLALSRKQGSDLAAVFWGVFAGTRGLAVPAAIFLPPDVIMILSFVASLVGALMLSIFGESNVHVLFAFTALLGFGMASIYATGLLWLEKRIEITNRIGSAMAISSSLGAKIFPVVVGQTVQLYPISFMYIVLAICTSCVLLFAVASLLSRQLVVDHIESVDNPEVHHNIQVTAEVDDSGEGSSNEEEKIGSQILLQEKVLQQ